MDEMDGSSEDKEKSFEKENNVLLRQYQIKLIDVAEKQNTIIFLPTGAGKTFIALWIIKSRSHEVRKPYNEGGKRTFFLVNTKSLVEQQAAVIEQMTDLTVGRYTGDLNVDFWDNRKWQDELKKNQVMVMTAQILANMLASAFIYLEKINVMVFDECHHAVCDHPYRVIMKQFENVCKENQPLVLGLSATLLNGNLKVKEGASNLMTKVQKNVLELETTLQAKVATSEELSDVLKFSTCPEEKIQPCQGVDKDDTYRLIGRIYEDAKKSLELVIFPSDEDDNAVDAPDGFCTRLKKDNSMNKRVKNALDDAMKHLDLMGLYGGAVAALYHIIQFEKLRLDSDNEGNAELITFIITTLNKIRRIMMKRIPESDSWETIKKFSSPKLCSLLDTLHEYKDRCEQKQETFACIVFVERRITAVVLCHILKVLSEKNQELNFITPEFMVGGTANPMRNTRECMLEQIRNEDVIKKFLAYEINLLVATDVVEEGIDLPFCNLVIKFDKPTNYRSYVQSKGRARSKTSEYIALIGVDEYPNLTNSLNNYRDTETALKELLIGKTDDREVPSDDIIASELYKTDIEPYFANGPGSAYVTGESAISCIERYCQMLPQDYYSLLAPLVWVKKKYELVSNETQEKRTAILQLPIACPFRENIEGDNMSNSKHAKRSVFIKAVKLLHQMGELTDDLLPRKRVIDVSDYQLLFPHYVHEKIPKDKPQPGTKQRTQIYGIQHAKCLTECIPKPEKTLYLHVITTKAVYEKPTEHRRSTMHDLLNSATGYAILSSKKMPPICKFPIFTKPGQVDCDLIVNATSLTLTEEQLAEVKKFHFDIFAKLLNLVKSSFAFDHSNEENSFFIVPVDKNSRGSFQILWEIVTKRDSFPERYRPIYGKDKKVKRILAEFFTEEELEESKKALKRILMAKEERDGDEPPNKKMKVDTVRHQPSDSEREALVITEEKYNLTVVSPYYRPDETFYLVTRVSDMTPMSKFPDNYKTYDEYFKLKYNLDIKQKNQPLLEAKALSSSYNFLRPRTTAKTGGIKGKKKRLEEQDGFDEHLVPELCTHFPFPAGLWLKATFLPSILYRIGNICVIEEFRQRVAGETDLGAVDLPAGTFWNPFTVDESCLKGQDEESEKSEKGTLNRGILNQKPSIPDSVKKQTYSWGDDELPLDLERNLNAIAPCDLQYYVQFANRRLDSENSRVSPSRVEVQEGDNIPIIMAPKVSIPLDLIRRKPLNSKLELAELIQAFTTSKSNDICSLERLETLGDSFLKFASAVFSFRKFKEFDEGKLVSLKDKIVGNKNLLYCARAKGFASSIVVDDFQPKSDWNPPLLKIPKILVDGICSRSLGITTIYELYLDPEEQFSGKLSPQTISNIYDILEEGKGSDKSSPMELLLSRKTIPDKTVADCSEALIGVYLKNFGIEGGFKFLNWLGVMAEATYDELIKTRLDNAFLQGANRDNDVSFHLNRIDFRKLERTLNYQFKEKSFLLEALTHSSYIKNRLTYNYQRLELLGDAVLDFLITSYIYEHCGKLTPGKVTDLRSALVNNVTFACLAVKYDFHKYLLSLSSSLLDPIDRFVRYQKQRNHTVDEAVLILLDESEVRLSESVEVPKVLGDLFESIAGAIFLDSGNSLEAVWNVFYPLMKKEIDMFSTQTPKQPIRLLYESLPNYTPNMKVTPCPDKIHVLFTIEILSSGAPKFFHGIGRNKQLAKKSAAKHALKFILESKGS